MKERRPTAKKVEPLRDFCCPLEGYFGQQESQSEEIHS